MNNKKAVTKDVLSRVLSGVDFEGLEENTLQFDNPDLKFGFVQIPKPVLVDTRLSSTDKILYAQLLSYAFQSRRCFPGRQQLAKDMGCNILTVTRALSVLRECKLIKIERRGQGKVNIYHIRKLTDAYPQTHDRGASF